jgi:uncharacterized membrane protein YagU involved in acid resistance
MALARLTKAVLWGGLLGGTLDLLYAVSFAAFNDVPPSRLFQTVASGLLGSQAYAGGVATQWLGIGCHFALTLAWASLYAIVASTMPLLVRRPLVAAMAFGVVVFLCMRLVVLPLSAYPRPVTFPPLGTALDLLSHMFLFALPIVVAIARVGKGRLPGRAHPGQPMRNGARPQR